MNASLGAGKLHPLVDFALPNGGRQVRLVMPETFTVELPGGEIQVSRVQVTPEAAVFDHNRQLIYDGRIDDWYRYPGGSRPSPTTHDLDDAVRQLMPPAAIYLTFAFVIVYRKFSGSLLLSRSLPSTRIRSRVSRTVWPSGGSTSTMLVGSGTSQNQQPTGYSINNTAAWSKPSPVGCINPLSVTRLPSSC